MTSEGTPAETPQSRLSDFLRGRQHELVADWSRRVRSLSPALELSEEAIIDHLPDILGRIADLVDAARTGGRTSLGELPNDHAVDRLGRGFDFDQIVAEYALLRRSVLDLWEQQVGRTINLAELRNLDAAIDESIAQSAVRFAQAREKLLKALDRVSEAALGSADLDSFLQDLMVATLEGTESVDTCVVLLREGDILRVRAAVGLEEELPRRYSLRLREGFAGYVAAEAKPVFLRHAAVDPIVMSPVIRQRGVRALYGVPMMRNGKVIGVAHIGSLDAHEFSEEDKLLFRTVVSRATSGVVKAQILADLHRAEAAQRFLSEASRQFAESLDYEATLAKIARLAVPTIADWCVVDLLDGDSIRRVSVVHSDPEKERLARELECRYPTDPHASRGAPQVVRSGQLEWRAEVSDAELAATARDDEHLRILRGLGVKSYIIVPVTVRDQILGTISLVTAESRRRYSESDVRIAVDLARRAATSIDNARLYTDAQNAIAVRERVLAVVSHDLRNPLEVIGISAELLSRKASSPAAGEAIRKPVETIRRTARAMQHLVDDLLDMAAIQAGHLSFEPVALELQPIVNDVCDGHEALAKSKDVRLACEARVAGISVLADRRRVLQVLANLLGNAIKFCEPGGIVTVRGEIRESDVVISVADTGPGVPREHLESIFEPYQTLHREGKSGTGLGLYIAKGIVQQHGGRLWVESEPGHGATFCFTLRRAR